MPSLNVGVRLVGEDFTSRLEDLVDQAVTLQRSKRQDFGGQEKDQADKGSGFHDKGVDMSPILYPSAN